MSSNCPHSSVTCLNQYDFIRKYECDSCKEIMICSCDKEFGESFLPHQINFGSREGSRERIPVTLGFQKNVCPECRIEKPVAAPKAPILGATSKIVRYYWREIFFETTKRFYKLHPELNPKDPKDNQFKFSEERKLIEKQVISEIKEQHRISPKYQYNELSQADVVKITNTEVILQNAVHVQTEGHKVGILDGDEVVSVETYAAEYFRRKDYQTLEVESVPFHVLFGVFMYPIIQDVNDDKVNVAMFGSRNDYENKTSEEGLITTILPEDFGGKHYYERRKDLIQRHLFELESSDRFEDWLVPSSDLRQYLWAHRDKDVKLAKKVMYILGLENLKKVLNYLVLDYWKNYCGWPDLLVYNGSEFFFVEVKSSNDKLSEDQKKWFLGNYNDLGFQAKIFKVGKK